MVTASPMPKAGISTLSSAQTHPSKLMGQCLTPKGTSSLLGKTGSNAINSAQAANRKVIVMIKSRELRLPLTFFFTCYLYFSNNIPPRSF